MLIALALLWLQVGPAYASLAKDQLDAYRRDQGLAKFLAARRPKPRRDVEALTDKQMDTLYGRGAYRNSGLAGAPMPWQRDFHGVNTTTGNLYRTYTDIQVQPAHGAGLVLNRSYSSDDGRIGPFGIGWQHAYDIRMEEGASEISESGGDPANADINSVPRTDFFGGRREYHRDADGLYSNPPGFHDQVVSDYGASSSSLQVASDTDTGKDGTTKHYVNVVTNANGSSANERYCDWIEDRRGNRTTLSYGFAITRPDGSKKKLLTEVTDPSGRSLKFTWKNLNAVVDGNPAWRISKVEGPFDAGNPVPGVTYAVTYDYYTDPTSSNAANELYNLRAVHLDADGINRTTTYAYTGLLGETGLLASVTDPLGHATSYQYFDNGAPQLYHGHEWHMPFSYLSLYKTVSVNVITEPPAGTGRNFIIEWFGINNTLPAYTSTPNVTAIACSICENDE